MNDSGFANRRVTRSFASSSSLQSIPSSEDSEDFETRDLTPELKTWEGKSGVYVISPSCDIRDAFLVKVGLSRKVIDPISGKPHGGLGRRLDSYLLCYPMGFFLFGVLQTKDQDAIKIESSMHSYLVSKGFQTSFTHSRRHEWFHLKLNEIFELIGSVSNSFGGMITKPYIFNPPLYIDSNGRSGYNKKAMTPHRKENLESWMTDIPETADVPRVFQSTITQRGRNLNSEFVDQDEDML